MDKRNGERSAAVAKAQACVGRIEGSLGRTLAEHHASTERVRADREELADTEYHRKRADTAEREQTHRQQRIREMVEGNAALLGKSARVKLAEQEEDRRQQEIFKRQYEESVMEERAVAAKARRARGELDATLLDQMRDTLRVHSQEFGFTSQMRKRELDYNKDRIKEMAAQGVHLDRTGNISLDGTECGKR
mmetsp:Transcript_2316/g.6666  ORF Transcript_2316/g.6666 Transcript_2316/m.6666 type:complete len:192 (+) Transcript_2316:697-1272(+)